MLCRTVVYYTVLCCSTLCHAMLCNAMLCNAMLYCAVLCYDKICYATLCYAMLCSAMLCYAMPCYAMPCYIMCRCYAMRVSMPLFSATSLPYCIGLLTHGLLNAWFAHASRKLTAYHRIAHGTALSRSVAADLLQLIPRRAL